MKGHVYANHNSHLSCVQKSDFLSTGSNSGWITSVCVMAIAAAAMLAPADALGGLATARRLLVDLEARQYVT